LAIDTVEWINEGKIGIGEDQRLPACTRSPGIAPRPKASVLCLNEDNRKSSTAQRIEQPVRFGLTGILYYHEFYTRAITP
jgi:hypothetical protein